MTTVDGTDVCMACGEEYWYQLDCRTGEYTKLSMCACDRRMANAEDFLKAKGLLQEFEDYHKKCEEERATGGEEIETPDAVKEATKVEA